MVRSPENILEAPSCVLHLNYLLSHFYQTPLLLCWKQEVSLAIQVEASCVFLVFVIALLLTPEGIRLSGQAIDSL